MINFLLLNPEVVTKSCNPRSLTTFFNSIASIKDFEKNLPLIQMLGEGSIGPEAAQMFTLFINNKLDRLISPSEMVEGKNWSEVKIKMQDMIGTDAKYRADIAAVLGIRIINYCQIKAKETTPGKDVLDRIMKLVTEDGLLAKDIQYSVMKSLINGEKKEVFRNKLCSIPAVAKMLLV